MDVKLWEIASQIADARDLLQRSSEDALEASGYAPARRYGPGNPEPGDPGWQEMVRLSDNLSALADQLETIIPAEVAKAIEEEAKYLDEMSDKADAAGY